MSKKINNPFRGQKGYKCFGCSPDNPIGLHMNFRLEGDEVICDWTPGELYQGWMNVLHGGIQATLMDEIASWWVMVKLQTAGVTSKMEVRLLKTAHMDQAPFRLVARLQEMNKNIALVKVELFDRNQQLCADSIMHYFTWPEHIARERMHYPGIEGFIK